MDAGSRDAQTEERLYGDVDIQAVPVNDGVILGHQEGNRTDL